MDTITTAAEARAEQLKNTTEDYYQAIMAEITAIVSDGRRYETQLDAIGIKNDREGANHAEVAQRLKDNGFTIAGTMISWAE